MVHNFAEHTPYVPIQQVTDSQPIRATCFHPSGEAYVVGSNSKALKICKYPDVQTIGTLVNETLEFERTNASIQSSILGKSIIPPLVEPEISFTCLYIHCGSVYCAAFNQTGNLLASGSNDQILHLIKYDTKNHMPEGDEYKLSIHSGTIRDVCFLAQRPPPTDEWDRSPSRHHPTTNLLASAGAGEFEINVSDCNVMKCVSSYRGHEKPVMSLHCGMEQSNTFVSGSLDGTIRLWDLRSRESISKVSNTKAPNSQAGSDGTPVGCVRLDPSGRLVVSGHKDGSCMLYDLRAGKRLQIFQAHEDDIRTLNFSPKSYYLLTGSYDGSVRLFDIQGQLTSPLHGVQVAQLADKCVQTSWHPHEYSFVTTCADGTATLWTIPNFDEWINSTLTS